MKRRTFLRFLAGLALVPFLHVPVSKTTPPVWYFRSRGLSEPLYAEYNTSPAEWIHTHGITYPNGRHRLIPITRRFTA